jgi:hypothetical protein
MPVSPRLAQWLANRGHDESGRLSSSIRSGFVVIGCR